MTEVVASALVGTPVFRMQAVLNWRNVGTSAHRAIEQLQAAGVEESQITALLGLRSAQLATLLATIKGDGGQRVSELRVWIDPAHRSVFSTDRGLDLVPHMRHRNVPLLGFGVPAAGDLPPQSYTRAASTREAGPKRAIVDEVHDLTLDIRTRTAVSASGKRRSAPTDYLLLLPDTLLVVRAGTGEMAIEVQWRGMLDPDLTEAAQATLLHGDHAIDPRRLTPALAQQAQTLLHTALGSTPEEAHTASLDPGMLRRNIVNAIAEAEQQIVIVIGVPDTGWPAWLKRAHRDALDRGVRWLASDNGSKQPEALRRLADFGILVVRDGDSALACSDALPLGGSWEPQQLTSQACLKLHDPQAVRRLLRALGAPAPAARQRQERASPLEDIAVDGLRAALQVQRAELPTGTTVAIEDDDIQAFCETARLENIDLNNPERVRKVADGVAWERVLYTECLRLASRHAELEIIDFRREAPVEGIDLDVIVSNRKHGHWWVLDAKNKSDARGTRQLRTMKLQLRVACERRWVPSGLQARGAIVYPAGADLSAAEDKPTIAHITLGQLEGLLLDTPNWSAGS